MNDYATLHLTLATIAALLATAIVVLVILVRRQRLLINRRQQVIERERQRNDELTMLARHKGLGLSAPSAPTSKTPSAQQLSIRFSPADCL